ncbi:MAG: ATP-binding cassette domain-containing protein, partial [Anaerolineae bacterium]|nr:ATP-binding cassette domain-containing protein [Anaerolineae bacterium]
MKAIFHLEGVGYRYPDGRRALAGIDLTVERGDALALLGANGSGKSTLLKVLDALYFPTEGQAWAFGAPLTERQFHDDSFAYAFRRRVGLLFQDADVQLFSPTVWDEVAFAP